MNFKNEEISLCASGLCCARGEKELFHNLSLNIKSGETLFVLGENGSGKSTLLRILCGYRSPDKGAVLWGGKNIAEVQDEFNRSITYIGHVNGVKNDLTVRENLNFEKALCGLPNRSIGEALTIFDLHEYFDSNVLTLSAGQKED